MGSVIYGCDLTAGKMNRMHLSSPSVVRRPFCLLGLLLVVVFGCGPSSQKVSFPLTNPDSADQVSLGTFRKIKLGMSYAEVRSLIGREPGVFCTIEAPWEDYRECVREDFDERSARYWCGSETYIRVGFGQKDGKVVGARFGHYMQ